MGGRFASFLLAESYVSLCSRSWPTNRNRTTFHLLFRRPVCLSLTLFLRALYTFHLFWLDLCVADMLEKNEWAAKEEGFFRGFDHPKKEQSWCCKSRQAEERQDRWWTLYPRSELFGAVWSMDKDIEIDPSKPSESVNLYSARESAYQSKAIQIFLRRHIFQQYSVGIDPIIGRLSRSAQNFLGVVMWSVYLHGSDKNRKKKNKYGKWRKFIRRK